MPTPDQRRSPRFPRPWPRPNRHTASKTAISKHCQGEATPSQPTIKGEEQVVEFSNSKDEFEVFN